MIDREKVINGTEHCDFGNYGACYENECPYYQSNDCTDELKNDILALPKEQEAVKPRSMVRHGANAQIQHFCGNCNTMLHGKPNYCSECGKGILW